MLETILVFVAAVAVPFITILGTWVKSMIDRRDRRATISAELDILAKLDPESDAAQKLTSSIDRQILELIDPPKGWTTQTSAWVITATTLTAVCVVVVLAQFPVSYAIAFTVGSALYAVVIPIGLLAVRRARERHAWEASRVRP
ncbi:membrane protein [Gordonia phage Budski]|uniref:Membrane protein n=1 Tax=Gordonia phage Matteo TaxID=2759392 RepID=A0A7L7SP74_9CAUD|nr:membrane protein [Gordonia phage Matteo]QOC55957.1 membrane protein [Gordonia phage Matteo]WKW86316.1 membrane protein [Gordonia phage Budski]